MDAYLNTHLNQTLHTLHTQTYSHRQYNVRGYGHCVGYRKPRRLSPFSVSPTPAMFILATRATPRQLKNRV